MSIRRTIAVAALAGVALTIVAIGRRRTDRQQTGRRVGSQSTGAGAGKVVFNPFSVRRKSAGGDSSGTF